MTRISVLFEVRVDSKRLPFKEELDEVSRTAGSSLLTRLGRRAAPYQTPELRSSARELSDVAWQGENEGGEYRVRRPDAASLVVEKLVALPGLNQVWRAADEETAAQVFERALLDLLGPP